MIPLEATVNVTASAGIWRYGVGWERTLVDGRLPIALQSCYIWG